MRFSSRLRRALRTPAVLPLELNAHYHKRLRGDADGFNPGGVDVFEEDWDTLVVLDACRYDVFAVTNTIDGSLSCRESKGAVTKEFLRANVAGRELHDTAYVTANPMLGNRHVDIEASFHDVVRVWRDDWDDGTVPPAAVTNRALAASERYPEKRLLVHYLQPHRPFVGPTAEANPALNRPPVRRLLRSRYDPVTYERAYVETLERTLPEVERLVAGLDGKTVVSSDHGERLGDRPAPIPLPWHDFGHYKGNYTSELVEVPWLVTEYDGRREVTATPPVDREDERSVAMDRLRDLGYVD